MLEVESYSRRWVGTEFLRAGSDRPPGVSLSRVANHSWIHGNNDPESIDVLMRLDYVIATDDFIQVGGTNNGTRVPDITTGSYNAVIVGRTDGGHAMGTNAVGDYLYGAGRAKPDIVAPARFTSIAAPRVASAAAMLVGYAHDRGPHISRGSYGSPRTKLRIHHAETAEAIKAALMAGADRRTANATADRIGDITDYRADPLNRTENGLDVRFGAGQLNVRNSYHILAAGEQEGRVGPTGFDYAPAFGGAEGSPRVATYRLAAPPGAGRLKVALVWNLRVTTVGEDWDPSATLYNLDLELYDLAERSTAAASRSRRENTENIRAEVRPGRDYELRVTAAPDQADFDWDYAIAWQTID